jgi:hypothetical protein
MRASHIFQNIQIKQLSVATILDFEIPPYLDVDIEVSKERLCCA